MQNILANLNFDLELFKLQMLLAILCVLSRSHSHSCARILHRAFHVTFSIDIQHCNHERRSNKVAKGE